MSKKRYRKYFLIEIILVVVIFIALYPVLKIRELRFDDVRNIVKENLDLEQINVGDEKTLKKLYNLNNNDIEDFISYAPKSNMDTDEILVLKLKDEKDMSIIKKEVKKRIDSQGESFKNYRPENYEIIKNSVLEDEGKYLILIISKNASNINETIKKYFK